MPKIREITEESLEFKYDYDNTYDDCLNDFMNRIADDITGSCMIPMSLPKTALANIIKNAKGWFEKYYEDYMQENYYVVPNRIFNDPKFRQTRSITLNYQTPSGAGKIYSVFGVYRTNENFFNNTAFGFADKDFTVYKSIYAGLLTGRDATTAGSAQMLEEYVIYQMFFDMAKNIMENPLSYAYNRLTNVLKFTGENPNKDVVLHVYETIPDCALYQDEAFFRYVSAAAKIQMGNKMSIFSYKLPGNIEINASTIQDLGESELEAVKEEIKSQNAPDYFFHT